MTQTAHETTAGAVADAPVQIQDGAAARPAAETAAAERRARRMAWLWFGPLIVLALLRFWINTRAEALPNVQPIVIAPYVQTFAGHDDAALRALMWKASQPLLIGVAVLAAVIFIAWLAVRRWGGRRMGIVATALWCVICAGAALAMIARHVNRVALTPLPPVTTTVIAAQPYPSTENAPGGALAWLTLSGAESPDGTPWRVRIEGADFRAMPAGTRVTLQRARGALWGLYLTGSDAPQARPLPDSAPGPAHPGDPS